MDHSNPSDSLPAPIKPDRLRNDNPTGVANWYMDAAGGEMDEVEESDPTPTEPKRTRKRQTLKAMKPIHRRICAYVAKGMKYRDIGAKVGIDANEVSTIVNYPVCQVYIAEMNKAVNARLEALFERAVDVIADGLDGNADDTQLKAARLQLEASRRIGAKASVSAPVENSDARLLTLSERLVGLLAKQKETAHGRVIDGEFRAGQSTYSGYRESDGTEGEGAEA